MMLLETYLSPIKDAPKVQPRENFKPLPNYERTWNDYKEDGYWYESVLEYIPIDEINMYLGSYKVDITNGVITIPFHIVDSDLELYDDGVIFTLVVQYDSEDRKYEAYFYNEKNALVNEIILSDSLMREDELNELNELITI